MAASQGFVALVRERLWPVGDLSTPRLFGMNGVGSKGVIFGMVANDALYFRVDATNQDAFLAAGPAEKLTMELGGEVIEMPFWRVPEGLLDDPERLLAWARDAFVVAREARRRRQGLFARKAEGGVPVTAA